MAQHDYVIDNQAFPATRADLNSVLQAIVSNNSGSSAPSTTFANQIWYDSSANILYMRNEDNDANIPLLQLDQSADVSATLATLIDVLDASGTNTAGTDLTIRAGAGTGTGAGGSIKLEVADGGSSGSSVNSHATAVTIADNGNVGIGTNSPHDAGTNFKVLNLNGVKGGSLAFSRGTNSATKQWAIRTSDDDDLRFEYGSTLASEAARITSEGDGLLNTTSVIQSAILSVKGNASRNGITSQVTNNAFFSFIAANASGSITFYVRGDGVVVAPTVYSTAVSASLRDVQIDSSGFLGYSTSTRASKGNIEDLEDVSWLSKLNPVSFNRKVFDRETNTFKDELLSETEYGLIAEDVEAVNKNLCFYNETEDGQELAGITYSKLITPLLKALQEANAKIETLEAKVTALENA